MHSTRAEWVFEKIKKFLSPVSIWKKVLVPQHDLLKSFGTLTTKPQKLKKFLYAFCNFTIVFAPLTLNKKNPKEFKSFFKSCLKMLFKNTETILN